MFAAIFSFELRYQLKQPLFWTMVLVFALLTFGAVSSENVSIGGSLGNIHRNAPIVVIQLITMMTILGMFAVTAFVAGSIQRDHDTGSSELFFSKPIRRLEYLAGRFVAALVISSGVLAGAGLGILIGGFMPWIDPERLGPLRLMPYVWGFVCFVLPNLFFTGAIFFALAGYARSMLMTYLGVVIFFVIYALSGTLTSDLENETIGALLDPFGLAAISMATRYWTVAESNMLIPEFTREILLNRLIWMAVAFLALGVGYATFRPIKQSKAKKRRKADSVATAATAKEFSNAVPTLHFSGGSTFRQFLRQWKLEMIAVFKSAPFIIILLFGILNVLGAADSIQRMYGTSTLPVTYLMLQTIQSAYLVLLVIIVTFYAGDVIWRERSLRIDEVFDALPLPSWVPMLAKLAALLLVSIAFLVAGAIGTMGWQLWKGYTNLELGVYAKGLLYDGYPFLLVCLLAVFLQVLSRNKFIGYLVMIVYMVSQMVLVMLDFNHNLYNFAGAPSAIYSDMNSYGHFVKPAFWFYLYWTFLGVVLATLSVLLWKRGTAATWATRIHLARQRLTGPTRVALAIGIIGFIASGAWIFYNTNVLNEYVSPDTARERMAAYEKQYRQYIDIVQPRITATTVDVDIFPDERRMETRGVYTLANIADVPIEELHVDIRPAVTIKELAFGGRTPVLEDSLLGYYIYRLAEPMMPGEEREFRFEVAVEHPGFRNHASGTSIVSNGTFFNNQQYFPTFGYDSGRQLVNRNHRRKNDLPPEQRLAKVDDDFARRNNYISTDSDWIDFEATISTSNDQIAIAPGYLEREWQENGRRYFHYVMDAPILNFYAFLSADYAVKRDQWIDVAIEIYHHQGHDYNVDRMVYAIKKSLDYFSENFSPYQHRQVRIIEFPRYASFAQSFPNTIPFSESIGFIADLEDEEDIDYVFYVTAHEVAHQWWAHQVMGGNVQGSTMIVETMAQYSSLMVMEQEYGKEQMRKFLKYELDRYLRGRGGELVEEMPLLLVENQSYIHYNKGSLIMYGLRDYIGEEAVNNALSAYIADVGFEGPPWTNSLECFDHFAASTPDSLQYVLHDMFRSITLFENRVVEASCVKKSEESYLVTLDLRAKKVHADGDGLESEGTLHDWIDIGVFGEEDEVLYLEKHLVSEEEFTVQIEVEGRPVEAGIDPYNKLVDRVSNDNVKKVDLESDEVTTALR